jgi:hypothetical protein
LPSLSGHLPSMRAMYCAAPGRTLIEGDWAQQELNVMYWISGDEVLGKNLATGDVYTEDAKLVFNLPDYFKRCKCEEDCVTPDKHVKPSARQSCKVTHLTGQYGGGVRRVFEVALEEDRKAKFSHVARVYQAMWDPRVGTYKGTVGYWKRETDLVLGRPQIFSESRILGRRLYYPRPPERSRLVNYPIQATAADMTTLAEIMLDDLLEGFVGSRWAGFPAFQIMNQHDCLILETDEDPAVVRDCALLLHEVMGQEYLVDGVKRRCRIDFKVGPVWADMKDYKLAA